ncbi:MAG: permease-like cell division protein FtsX [Clostridiales bacterium]|nr:permease-like cell division protein FtsX [Clostridiales bacterium]
MKINNLGYLIKEGFHGIFLHGFMSFAAICVTIACLLIVGSFSILAYNLDVMVDNLNKTSEIMVYVDSSLSDAEARSIGTIINQLDNVQKSVFVSREEALDNFISDHDNNAAFNGVQSQDLRHRYVVTLEDNALMEQTDNLLKNIPGVAKTNAAYELAQGFTTIQSVLNVVSIALIATLLVVSLLIISNTIKLAMYDRKDEIAIMKMVGATNSFIRLPFIVEGFTLGMIGAILAFGLEWVLYDALVERVNTVDALRLFTFVPFTGDLMVPMLMTFGAAGLFVGIVGSWTSIRKFMDV